MVGARAPPKVGPSRLRASSRMRATESRPRKGSRRSEASTHQAANSHRKKHGKRGGTQVKGTQTPGCKQPQEKCHQRAKNGDTRAAGGRWVTRSSPQASGSPPRKGARRSEARSRLATTGNRRGANTAHEKGAAGQQGANAKRWRRWRSLRSGQKQSPRWPLTAGRSTRGGLIDELIDRIEVRSKLKM